jgi:hypothetical protein
MAKMAKIAIVVLGTLLSFATHAQEQHLNQTDPNPRKNTQAQRNVARKAHQQNANQEAPGQAPATVSDTEAFPGVKYQTNEIVESKGRASSGDRPTLT